MFGNCPNAAMACLKPYRIRLFQNLPGRLWHLPGSIASPLEATALAPFHYEPGRSHCKENLIGALHSTAQRTPLLQTLEEPIEKKTFFPRGSRSCAIAKGSSTYHAM